MTSITSNKSETSSLVEQIEQLRALAKTMHWDRYEIYIKQQEALVKQQNALIKQQEEIINSYMNTFSLEGELLEKIEELDKKIKQ